MRIRPLHRYFGVEVEDLDLNTVRSDVSFPQIRELFETHSLLLFRNQSLSDETHFKLAKLFGPIEDRSDTSMSREGCVAPVSNARNSELNAEQAHQHLLHLQANMLWHTDSTFLPFPALANLLRAEQLPDSGGETEFVSTRAGFRSLPKEEQQNLRHTWFWHRYSHSRAKIDLPMSKLEKFTMWKDQKWRAVWRNPVNGEEALYIASHVFSVEGMDKESSEAYVDGLLDAMTQPDAIYRHHWLLGDIILWDERATLHRGRPWPYDQTRTLMSACVSARVCDGLDSVSPECVTTRLDND